MKVDGRHIANLLKQYRQINHQEIKPAMTSTTPSVNFEIVTPEIAASWLKLNTQNRNVRRLHVENLTEAMRRGDFVVNGDTLRFDEKGALLDGQHRLLAIVASGIAQKCLVVRGVPRNAQDTIDRNEGRTVGDALTQAGFNAGSTLGSAAKLVQAFEEDALGWVNARGKFHPRDAKLVIAKHSKLPDSVDYILSLRSGLDRVYGARSVLSCLHYICSRVEQNIANEFFARLSDGVGLQQTDPVLLLRHALIDDRRDPRTKLSQPLKMALIIKAWNSAFRKRPLKRLRWGKDEKFPQVEGFTYSQGKPVWP